MVGMAEVTETVKFVALFDKFFDCLNISNFTNGTLKRKAFKHPYHHVNDFRLAVSGVIDYDSTIHNNGWRKLFFPIWTKMGAKCSISVHSSRRVTLQPMLLT